MRYPETRHERRLKARIEAAANAMTPRLPKHLRAGRPRYGVDPTPEQVSERERILKKHGYQADERKADRRQGDRRKMTMSPDEVEDWLKRNGISSGDRRKGERRQGDRRR
jgi:hypothetical protein